MADGEESSSSEDSEGLSTSSSSEDLQQACSDEATPGNQDREPSASSSQRASRREVRTWNSARLIGRPENPPGAEARGGPSAESSAKSGGQPKLPMPKLDLRALFDYHSRRKQRRRRRCRLSPPTEAATKYKSPEPCSKRPRLRASKEKQRKRPPGKYLQFPFVRKLYGKEHIPLRMECLFEYPTEHSSTMASDAPQRPSTSTALAPSKSASGIGQPASKQSIPVPQSASSTPAKRKEKSDQGHKSSTKGTHKSLKSSTTVDAVGSAQSIQTQPTSLEAPTADLLTNLPTPPIELLDSPIWQLNPPSSEPFSETPPFSISASNIDSPRTAWSPSRSSIATDRSCPPIDTEPSRRHRYRPPVDTDRHYAYRADAFRYREDHRSRRGTFSSERSPGQFHPPAPHMFPWDQRQLSFMYGAFPLSTSVPWLTPARPSDWDRLSTRRSRSPRGVRAPPSASISKPPEPPCDLSPRRRSPDQSVSKHPSLTPPPAPTEVPLQLPPISTPASASSESSGEDSDASACVRTLTPCDLSPQRQSPVQSISKHPSLTPPPAPTEVPLQLPPISTPASASSESSGEDSDASASDAHSSPDDPSPKPTISDDLPISLSDDETSYWDLIKRMAQSLGLPVLQPQPVVSDPVYDVVQLDTIALPMSSVLLQAAKTPWDKPSSAPASSCDLDHMYKVQEPGAEFLFKHPKPNSTVVTLASKSKWTHSAPLDKESRKLDSFGRRFYSAGALGIKITNYMACMSRYQYALWERLSEVFTSLPDDKCQLAHKIQKEGLILAKQQLKTSKDALDTFSETMASAIALRRHSWLHSTFLQSDTKAYIEDLPFDGEGLFHASTDSVLQGKDKSIKGSHTLGVAPSSKPFKSQY
ncbi:PREDICTED: TATA box-binding protein-associated factor RNA polymerase I subunit D isoform X1 [Gekko japonicus]|uniref:TATA box-binding protein-associated factor RNA polymerase I subunit D isoform X1 n=1 Tax=Gekko japonicus TaxID=146911 RepID=A0ABM1JWD6_GEKJA|nr:PREDICTED: TATA box-binding protein-associated factor RNA polymerase I subunit D isoform X1 [Gekko japonicus]